MSEIPRAVEIVEVTKASGGLVRAVHTLLPSFGHAEGWAYDKCCFLTNFCVRIFFGTACIPLRLLDRPWSPLGFRLPLMPA